MAALALAVVTGAPAFAAAQEPATGTLVEDLRIDGNEALLVRISPFAVARDGTMFVGQAMDRRVVVFDPSGVAIDTIGGYGDGPGEIRTLGLMGWHWDTLWVSDLPDRQIMLFGGDGELARTLTVFREVRTRPSLGEDMPAAFRVPSVARLLADGSFVNTVYAVRGSEATEWGERTAQNDYYFRMGQDGVIQELLGEIPTRYHPQYGIHPLPRSPDTGWTISMRAFPNMNYPEFVVSPNGDRVANVSAVVEGPEAGTVRITMLDVQGDTLYAARERFQPIELPRSVAREAIDSVADAMERIRREAVAEWLRQARDQIPNVYPALSGSVIGRDGSLWIGLRGGPTGGGPYLVLDAEGETVGRVMVGPRKEILAADLQTVWMNELDSLDVPSIVRYRVAWH